MSGVAIIRELLVNYPPISELVPAARIRGGVLPQGIDLPAISITTVYASEFKTIARRRSVKQTRERVQVTVLAKADDAGAGYAQMKTLLKACALGAGVHTGVVKGYDVKSVMSDGENPEIPPGDDRIYEQSRDFMVTFVEAN